MTATRERRGLMPTESGHRPTTPVSHRYIQLLHTALRFETTTSFSSNEYTTQISGTPIKSPDAWT